MSPAHPAPIILCSTPRLARSLRLANQRQKVMQGEKQWHASSIFTLSEWLSSSIECAILTGQIDAQQAPLAELSNAQEGLLWEQAIEQSLQSHVAAQLFDTAGLASAAMEANRLIIEWNISLDIAQATEETLQFLQWRQRFQQLCKQAGMLESVRFQAWQIECLEQGAGSLPNNIALVGFDRIHPHLKRLIQALKQRGISVNLLDLTLKTPQKCSHVVLTDQENECRAAVAWAKQSLTDNPNAQLAIVVPELETLRPNLARLLDETFQPDTVAPANAEQPRCYDFSLGVALSTLPIIIIALALIRLGWQKHSLLQTDITKLLHSPYWSSHQAEANARAKLEARMRGRLPLNFSAQRLLSFMQHAQEGSSAIATPTLLDDLTQLLSFAGQHTRRQLPSIWAETFKSALAATHWPGDRSLSSHEYQAMQSFERVWQQFSALDKLLGKVSPNEALQRFTQLCKAQIFQPETTKQPNLLVMGLLEASAEPLDAIWVMGMNDHVWPPLARPNPLIPAELQRKANTPNASSESQTVFATSVHQRLTKSARQVIFSSATMQGERQLRASPMMQEIETNSETMISIATLAEQLSNADQTDWQWLDDHLAPPIHEHEHVSGGTGLIKAQAICPAWAFYQYRLGARKLDEPVNGLDVMDRGNLVHAVLAILWKDQSSSQLLQLSPETLRMRIDEIAHQVLQTFNAEKEGALSEPFIQLESERLTKLVLAWLIEVEMQRPQGFQVSACEQAHQLSIEGVSIKLIIDRIDTLDNGQLVLMDYKTGRQLDYKNWALDTITEPQLPMYAAFVLEDQDVAAVCFAKLRLTELGFTGIAAESDLVQGVTVYHEKRGRSIFDAARYPNWSNILQHWKASITATALALKAGEAAICFEDEKQLLHCEVLPLLRLPERQLQYEHQQGVTS
jgi:probable DNA repair protein